MTSSSVDDDSESATIVVSSLGRARPQTPTLFGVTISSFSIKIFVNGVLDTVFFPSPGFSEMYASPDPVYVRGHPDYLLGCRLDYSLGLLEVYGREMRKEEFETMAQGFSGDSKSVVEPGNILLGCSDCSIQQVGF